jgi:hypothetical protein
MDETAKFMEKKYQPSNNKQNFAVSAKMADTESHWH